MHLQKMDHFWGFSHEIGFRLFFVFYSIMEFNFLARH